MTGRLQCDVGHCAGLTNDENLHPLRHLTPRQHRRIHHLPVLKQNTKYFLEEKKVIARMLQFLMLRDRKICVYFNIHISRAFICDKAIIYIIHNCYLFYFIPLSPLDMIKSAVRALLKNMYCPKYRKKFIKHRKIYARKDIL